MSGKDALKACPFCGSDKVSPYRPALTQTWAVICDDCDARAAVATSRDVAIHLWNTRSSGWQPIETAPKDGDPVLLYKPDERRSGKYTLAGYWGEWPGSGECWIAVGGQPLGWRSSVGPQGYPTHWMPLPSSPSGAE